MINNRHAVARCLMPAAIAMAIVVLAASTGHAQRRRDAEDVNIVTITGKGDSRDSAVQDALRNAVERGAGQFIHSQSETNNYQIVLDKVLSKSAGFVKKYDVNKTIGPDANGIVTVEITAHVSVKEVATEWGEIQILLQQKGKPRIMVVLGETLDGNKQDDSIVASEIEKQLLSNDFPLVDKSQFNEIQQRDIKSASFEDDLDRVIALGKLFGAELIITGSATADFASAEDLYGVKAYMYGAAARFKVVRTDNAATLVSDNVTARKGARAKTSGGAEALREVGKQAAQKIQDGIVAKWGREVAESQSINLEVSGISFAQRNTLTKAMKAFKSVKGVQERTFSSSIANYTVDIKGSANDFATALSEIADLKVEITDVTANLIKCKIMK